MNTQQTGFVSPYPPQQGFQFPYQYPQPGASQPLQYQYPHQQQAQHQHQHQQPQPPPPQPLNRQQVSQAPPQFFQQPFKPVTATPPPPNVAAAAQSLQQFRSQSTRSVRTGQASSAALPPAAPVIAPPPASSPDVDDQNAEDGNDDQQNDEEQYGPNGTDEHGAIFNIPPPPEITYANEEELEKAIHAWSKEHGYELVRRASKRNAKGVLYKRYYHCSKHGKRANTGKLTAETRQRVNRKSGRVDCPMSLAAVAVDPTNPDGEWQIRHRKSHHNHGPFKAVELAGHRRRARMGAVEQAIDGLFAIGTSTAQVLQFLQKTHPDGLFTRTDVANMKNRYKKWGTCADRIQRGENHISTVRYKNGLGIPIPCIPCRQQKMSCGSERPTCKNCQQSGKQCEYSHEQPANNDDTGVDSTHIDLTADSQLQQENSDAQQGAPQAAPGPTRVTAEQTQMILDNIKAFTAEQAKPTARLTLDSSSVEVLAQSSCGNGDSYKGLPFLNSEREWPAFRDAMIEAALKENTHDVLTGVKKEPVNPENAHPGDVEIWNEYIRQLAIYNRRNSLLLSALLSKTSPLFRNKIQSHTKADQAWNVLEEMCAPRGSETAYLLFCDLHAITLPNSGSLQNYIARLDSAYAQFKHLKLNTRAPPLGVSQNKAARRKDAAAANSTSSSGGAGAGGSSSSLPHTGAEAITEEMMVFLFLRGLGPEWQRWIQTLCLTSNIAGFGTGERLGFKEVCKAAVRQEVMARRVGGSV